MTSATNAITVNITFERAWHGGENCRSAGFWATWTHEGGRSWRMPGFRSGDGTLRARFNAPIPGRYVMSLECCGGEDCPLHGHKETFVALPYSGAIPHYRLGPVRVSGDGQRFEHADGTPFLWLGDTWWMGLSRRIQFPFEWLELIKDRLDKGFTVVQIVAGFYPDMPPYDLRNTNQAGFPWLPDYAGINPGWYDEADHKISAMVAMGITPCIVGSWGYHLVPMGVERMKQHWRNLVARYAAMPVVWCLAGECNMPFYMSATKEQDRIAQRKGWTEVARYLKEIDPFNRPMGVHPSEQGRDELEDPDLPDFEMLQTGHGDRDSIPGTVRLITAAINRKPTRPVVNSEVCYEGIGEGCRQEMQRRLFWTCFLNGCAGFTYGANGIWQFNREGEPYGPSPHGLEWGATPWNEAMRLPGSAHIGVGMSILRQLPWWRMQPHPEWAEPAISAENPFGASSAGEPGEWRITWFPPMFGAGTLCGLEAGTTYKATLIDPITGESRDIGYAEPDADGRWLLPFGSGEWRVNPRFQDWVVVLKRSCND